VKKSELEEIRNGMHCTEAAIRYGIPRSTLSDHKLGKVKPGVKSGPPPLLSTSEENDLVQFLLSSADIGYGYTRSEVLTLVSQMLARRGVQRTVSSGWWNKFLLHHPHLRT